MKKTFNYYIAIWAILFVAFNAVAFLSTGWVGFEKTDGAFWPGFIVTNLALIGQLVCAFIGLKEQNKDKLFLNVSFVKISYTGMIISAIVGIACMLMPFLPTWAGAIVCVLIFALCAISVLKAKAAAEIVSATGDKVKVKTAFIRLLTADAESLLAYAKTDEAKAAANKVYEAVRYSDPMSSDALLSVENSISEKFEAFAAAIKSGSDAAPALAEEAVLLVNDRNRKCKVLK